MDQQQLFLPVAEAYDRWSSFYDSYENPMVFMAAEIVNRSFSDVSGLSVFEFGCGTGRNLAVMNALGAKQTAGCDVSAGMLEVARSRVPQASLYQQDMSSPLPLADESFDVTLFCLTLEHISDIRTALREGARITKATGRISIIEIHPFYSLNGSAAHFERDGMEVRMPTYAHQFEGYLNAFGELGLMVTSCREWKPSDVGNPVSLQRLKRGPAVPITVEFSLARLNY